MQIKNKKRDISEYTPYSGFYDLRAFDIPPKEFKKLWGIQEFLHDVEMKRRAGNKHPQIQELREFSAKYQQALFAYPIINKELI